MITNREDYLSYVFENLYLVETNRDESAIFIEYKRKIEGVEGVKKILSRNCVRFSKNLRDTGEWRRLICEQVLLSVR